MTDLCPKCNRLGQESHSERDELFCRFCQISWTPDPEPDQELCPSCAEPMKFGGLVGWMFCGNCNQVWSNDGVEGRPWTRLEETLERNPLKEEIRQEMVAKKGQDAVSKCNDYEPHVWFAAAAFAKTHDLLEPKERKWLYKTGEEHGTNLPVWRATKSETLLGVLIESGFEPRGAQKRDPAPESARSKAQPTSVKCPECRNPLKYAELEEPSCPSCGEDWMDWVFDPPKNESELIEFWGEEWRVAMTALMFDGPRITLARKFIKERDAEKRMEEREYAQALREGDRIAAQYRRQQARQNMTPIRVGPQKTTIHVGQNQNYNNSGCFIATAAYGTPLDARIDVLREWRDYRLRSTRGGRAFIRTYYAVSPPIARIVTMVPPLRWLVRVTLGPIIRRLSSEYTGARYRRDRESRRS